MVTKGVSSCWEKSIYKKLSKNTTSALKILKILKFQKLPQKYYLLAFIKD